MNLGFEPCVSILWSGDAQKKTISVSNAFKEMKNAEILIKKMIGTWDASPTVCNVLSVEPFFDKNADFNDWFIQHNKDFRFFPIGCTL